MLARVPVPWGNDARGTKQIVSGRSRNIRWEVPEPEDSIPREQGVAALGRSPGVSALSMGRTIAGRAKSTQWVQEGSQPVIPHKDFDVLTKVVSIPTIYKNAPAPVIRAKVVSRPLSPLKWAVARLRRGISLPPTLFKSKVVAAVPSSQQGTTEIPPSLLAWAIKRGVVKKPPPETLEPLDPFTTKSAVEAVYQDTQEWVDQLAPSLLAWAVEKGIKKLPAEKLAKLDPFTSRTKVVALEDRRAIVMAALRRGEWCLVSEVEIFPPRLKRWLIQCNVRFIRWQGRYRVGGGGGGGQGAPFNGYVTEQGQVFYVAEDGATFYVQES